MKTFIKIAAIYLVLSLAIATPIAYAIVESVQASCPIGGQVQIIPIDPPRSPIIKNVRANPGGNISGNPVLSTLKREDGWQTIIDARTIQNGNANDGTYYNLSGKGWVISGSFEIICGTPTVTVTQSATAQPTRTFTPRPSPTQIITPTPLPPAVHTQLAQQWYMKVCIVWRVGESPDDELPTTGTCHYYPPDSLVYSELVQRSP